MTPGLASLLQADARCLDAAELLLDSLERLPSATAYRRLMEEIEHARRLARGPEAAAGTFEILVRRHLEASWRALEAVARFRFEWPRAGVETLLEALAGPGAMERLEAAVAGLDSDTLYSYLRLRHRYRLGRVDASAVHVRPLLEDALVRIAGDLRRWLEAREGDTAGLDAEVVLGPAGTDGSWYEPEKRRVVVGPGEFMVFERGGRVAVNPAIAVQGLLHELAGHAVQDAASADLPAPLRPDDRARLRFASLPASEGFAAWRTELVVPFSEEAGADLDLEDQDVELLRQVARMTPAHHALPALVGALAAKARQKPGFDAAGRMEALGHRGFGEMLNRAAGQPAYRLVYHASCFFGLEAVARAAGALQANAIATGAIARRLARGAWAMDCYEEAVGVSGSG